MKTPIVWLLASAFALLSCQDKSVAFTKTTPFQDQQVEFPLYQGYINDFEEIISSDDEKKLRFKILEFNRETGFDLTLLTIDAVSPFQDVMSYGNALAQKWPIGQGATEKGILLIFSKKLNQTAVWAGSGLQEFYDKDLRDRLSEGFLRPGLSTQDFAENVSLAIAMLQNNRPISDKKIIAER